MKQHIKEPIEAKIKEFNGTLRNELLNQLASRKMTMTKFEQKTGLVHSFIFNWRDGKTQLRKIENFMTVMKVLKKNLKIRI